jgi:outer membrane receptor protein involved in Fe transport
MQVALRSLLLLLCVVFCPFSVLGQAGGTLHGRVLDSSGGVVQGATVSARIDASGFNRRTSTDSSGHYQIAALPVGTFRVEARATGFRTGVVPDLVVEVGRTLVQDFHLEIGDIAETVVVTGGASQIDRATMSVGAVVTAETMRDIPLNGRHFVDLAMLVPGSVTPPQGGQFAPPSRGQGSFAINTAGGREDAVNFMLNGVNINNQSYGLIIFQPNPDSIQEFKIDNSTFSAESGRSSGAIVNIATRSGTNDFHGELFEFLRNDALDARNFFNLTPAAPSPFKRHQLGGHLGGPIIRNAAFFFVSYERLRQRQGLDVNSVTLSDAQRASISSPAIRAVAELMPRSNYVDETGTARWIGYAAAPVDSDQWSADFSYDGPTLGQIHSYFGFQNDARGEPTLTGNTLPGFGDTRAARRRVLTIHHARSIGRGGNGGVNEARLGFTRFAIDGTPNVSLNPTSVGIRNGVDRAIGLPQFNVAGAFNFGGPATLPQGRTDTTFSVSDTVSWLRGAHSVKLGGEFRRLFNNNYSLDTGLFNFPTIDAFVAGTANAFAITLGDRSSHIQQGALSFFVQDTYRWHPSLTFELGVRYEWNMSPTERDDRFVVFDASSVSLRRVGVDVDEIYAQNHTLSRVSA